MVLQTFLMTIRIRLFLNFFHSKSSNLTCLLPDCNTSLKSMLNLSLFYPSYKIAHKSYCYRPVNKHLFLNPDEIMCLLFLKVYSRIVPPSLLLVSRWITHISRMFFSLVYFQLDLAIINPYITQSGKTKFDGHVSNHDRFSGLFFAARSYLIKGGELPENIIFLRRLNLSDK